MVNERHSAWVEESREMNDPQVLFFGISLSIKFATKRLFVAKGKLKKEDQNWQHWKKDSKNVK